VRWLSSSGGFKTTALVEVEPISLAALTAAHDGHLLLRGRSGRFFGPDCVAALPFKAVDPSRQAELEQVAQVPVGLAELPAPAEMTWNEWVSLSPGALPLEQYVSSHLVETLLRFTLTGAGLRWVREYRAGRGSADFVILDGDVPVCVIEVKLAAVDSKDLLQLRRYTQTLGCRGILMDARRVQLVEAGEVLPRATFERRRMNEDDLQVVRRHLSQR
jgi:hypothetical protein